MSPEDVKRLLLDWPWGEPYPARELEVALEDATYPPLPSGSYRPVDSLPRYSRPTEPPGSRTVRVHATRPRLPDPGGVHPSDISLVWLPYVPPKFDEGPSFVPPTVWLPVTGSSSLR